MKVPLLDLKPQYETLKDEILKSIAELSATQMFILGPHVVEVEEKIAKYCQSGYGCAVASESFTWHYGQKGHISSLFMQDQKIEPDELTVIIYGFQAYIREFIDLHDQVKRHSLLGREGLFIQLLNQFSFS